MTEAHAAVSFAAPDEPFYLPGGQYEGLQLFIDPDAVQADSFLTVMGLEIGGIADYFCRDGVHCCPLSEAITDILDEQWSDAEYATPGELRYTAVRLLYELLRLPDDAEAPAAPRGRSSWCAKPKRLCCAISRCGIRPRRWPMASA